MLPGSINLLGRLPTAASSQFGNVDGPASSTDNAIVRFDGTTGNIIQNSVLIVADTTGALSGFTTGNGITFHGGGTITGSSGALTVTGSGADITLTPNATVLITTTKTLKFGATAAATIGVSADTTAGNITLTPPSAGKIALAGDVTQTVGKTLTISSGSNTRAGNATLVAGTVTVSNTTVTANTIVLLTRKTSGGTIGTAITYTLSAGVSFTITSDNVLDTSTFSYFLIENP